MEPLAPLELGADEVMVVGALDGHPRVHVRLRVHDEAGAAVAVAAADAAVLRIDGQARQRLRALLARAVAGAREEAAGDEVLADVRAAAVTASPNPIVRREGQVT